MKPVDTMGAGDAYISAFLMNYLAAEADEPDVDGDKITISLQKAAQFAATVIVKDGALGVGYDVDPARLPEIINLHCREKEEQIMKKRMLAVILTLAMTASLAVGCGGGGESDQMEIRLRSLFG